MTRDRQRLTEGAIALVLFGLTIPAANWMLGHVGTVCVPKGRPAALAYVSEFIEEAKASGLVRRALDEVGLTASQIAPAGMKP